MKFSLTTLLAMPIMMAVIFSAPVSVSAASETSQVVCPEGYICVPDYSKPKVEISDLTVISIPASNPGSPIGIPPRPATLINIPADPEIYDAEVMKSIKCMVIDSVTDYLSSGPGVIALQNRLLENGFDIPAITSGVAKKGYFGAQTEAALKAFQKKQGLSVTGRIDGETKIKINSVGYCKPSDKNNSDVASTTMRNVKHSPKIIVFPKTEMVARNQMVNFSWKAIDPDSNHLTWTINWGTGSDKLSAPCPTVSSSDKIASSSANFMYEDSHKWTEDGKYTVKVGVSDCEGGEYSYSFDVIVVDADLLENII